MNKINDKLSQFKFIYTDGNNHDFAALCFELDNHLDEVVGKIIQRSEYDKFNQRDTIHDVIVVYYKDLAIACGSYKKFDSLHAELKRMFVKKEYRNLGIGIEIIRRLEEDIVKKGFKYSILETGDMLEAASNLYRKLGYKIIPNYGQYKDMSLSICMQKKLK